MIIAALVGMFLFLCLTAYLFNEIMEENEGERRRDMGGKCIAKYVIVLILLTEPCRVSAMMPDPFLQRGEKCEMQFREKLGCAGGKNAKEGCDGFEFTPDKYIWPPKSETLCRQGTGNDYVVTGEIYCLRQPYGTEVKECQGDPTPLITTVYSRCCRVMGII